MHHQHNDAIHIRAASSGVANNIIQSIGQTPLVEMGRYLSNPEVRLFAKLEGFNPGGSAKDRPARRMLEEAMAANKINADTHIVESSSGNMGIGLAQMCCHLGLRFTCVIDPNAQAQNVAIIKAYGASTHLVEKPLDGDFLAARLAAVRKFCESDPNTFWPNQYANLENPASHEFGTIDEIFNQLTYEPDYLFVATSSTGTIQGCENYLRRHSHSTNVIAVDALGSVLFDGVAGPRKISGMGAGQLPPLATNVKCESVVRVSDARCIYGCRRAAASEAVLVGGSGGGVLEAIRSMQSQLSGKTVVAIIHDSGTRYMDTIYSDSWVESVLGVRATDLPKYSDPNY